VLDEFTFKTVLSIVNVLIHRGAGPCTLHAHYAHYAHFSNLAIPLKNKLQGFNPEKGGME
jgi:hypothetical protein